MLRVRDLNAGYGKFKILFDVSMTARDREITVIVGPNGSGKSTLLKTIFGFTTIYSGSITFNGEVIAKLPPHEVSKKGIAYLPQTENVFLSLTSRENLLIAGHGLSEEVFRDRLEEVMALFPSIKGFLNRRAETLSGGERKMLATAMALLKKPQLIMFDEPTSDLAPKVAMELLKKITELRDELKLSIILVEQNVRKALEIGDRAYLLAGGRRVYEGGASELLGHPKLGELFLGLKP